MDIVVGKQNIIFFAIYPKEKSKKFADRVTYPFYFIFFVSSSNLAIFHGGLNLPMRTGLASGVASIRNLYRAAYRSISRKWQKFKKKSASDEEPKVDQVHKIVPVEVNGLHPCLARKIVFIRDIHVCFQEK